VPAKLAEICVADGLTRGALHFEDRRASRERSCAYEFSWLRLFRSPRLRQRSHRDSRSYCADVVCGRFGIFCIVAVSAEGEAVGESGQAIIASA